MANRRRRSIRRLRFEQVEARVLLAADGAGTMDLNADGKISPLDALIVINQISRELNEQAPVDLTMDVNGDGAVTSRDALQIINRIYRDKTGSEMRLSFELRTIDGTGNHRDNPNWGAAGNEFVRLVDAAYADGIDEPAGTNLPSARAISNLICSQSQSIPNAAGLSDLIWQWGQFIDHDIDLTREGEDDPFNVAVPSGDPLFDPMATGEVEIELTRSAAAEGSGTDNDNPRAQVNDITAFIDGSMIYGSDLERANALRTFAGGRLKTSEGNLLPLNEQGLANAGGTADSMFLAGDIRANEQVGLISMHTLWVREHNRIADLISASDRLASDEKIYQRARSKVVAQIQAITYNEYLPALLGGGAVNAYQGYNASVDPRISNLFATAAFRFGHTQLPSEIRRINDDGSESESGNLALRDAFFNPDEIIAGGIDSVLKGLATGVAQAIDTRLIDDVRNFLFGPPGAGGFDLAALNIQRGRDHGLPDYNTVRTSLGLDRANSFADVTADTELQSQLEQVYGSVDTIDVWVGALAEDHLPDASVGELLHRVIRDQFLALRDGDRFWYENVYFGEELSVLRNTRLSEVIERNTSLTTIQENAFYAPGYQPAAASASDNA